MKLDIVISSNEPENAWNVFRLANLELGKKDEVKALSRQFEQKGGKVLACGTCIRSRKMEDVCEIFNIEILYNLVKENERTVFM